MEASLCLRPRYHSLNSHFLFNSYTLKPKLAGFRVSPRPPVSLSFSGDRIGQWRPRIKGPCLAKPIIRLKVLEKSNGAFEDRNGASTETTMAMILCSSRRIRRRTIALSQPDPRRDPGPEKADFPDEPPKDSVFSVGEVRKRLSYAKTYLQTDQRERRERAKEVARIHQLSDEAVVLAKSAELNQAIGKLQAARETIQDNPIAMLYTGILEDELSNYKNAYMLDQAMFEENLDRWESTLEEFVSAQRRMYKEAMGRGRGQPVGGDLDKAVKDLEQAVKDFRDLVETTENKAEVDEFEDRLHIYAYQKVAMRLMMNGKIDEAVAVLQKGYEVNRQKRKRREEIGSLLVEMLIYKGDYEEALNHESLKIIPATPVMGGGMPSESDARFSFYQAAAWTLLALEADSRWANANEWWLSFMTTDRRMLPPFSQPTEAEIKEEFAKFKEEMRTLNETINARKS